jgi:hypothetical protein
MAVRLSTALVNKLMDTGSFKDIFANGVIDIWSGTQPATADAAATGTLLCTVTKSSGTWTQETKAQGTVTFSGTIGGSITAINVNSIDILGATVTPVTDVTTTAALVAAAINNNPKNLLFTATSALGVVTITAVNGLGTLPNGWTVTASVTTITATPANMGSGGAATAGVNSANGLTFGNATAGVLSKAVSETWSGNCVADGTAGWFRLRTSGDAGTALDSGLIYPRFDGSIATSGAQMNLGSLTLTNTAPFIIPVAAFTLPQS